MSGSAAARDDRVIDLLNQLGDQLIRSERERAALAEKVAALEQARQHDHLRLVAQVERIEETVAETREVLQSRALVVTPPPTVTPVRLQMAPAIAALAAFIILAGAGSLLWLHRPGVAIKAKDAVVSAQVNPVAAPVTQPADPVTAFLNAQRDATPLATRLQPDPALPPVAQEIERRAFAGNAEAQHDLAALYTGGHPGMPTNYVRAAQWFREAGLGGIANARYNLGVLYQQGLGVDKDLGRAVGWYLAAAKLGHPEADYNLGIASVEGIGMPYDPKLAAHWFEQAARGGVVEASYNLGLVYENGLLGAPDRREALFWYARAANAGSREARVALAQLTASMRLKPADVPQVIAGLHPDIAPLAPSVPVPPVALATLTGNPAPVLGDQALIAQIQEQLMKRRLYPGPADGRDSPQTTDAIRGYQVRAGLAPDGKPASDLLAQMLSSTEPAAGDLQPQDKVSPADGQ